MSMHSWSVLEVQPSGLRLAGSHMGLIRMKSHQVGFLIKVSHVGVCSSGAVRRDLLEMSPAVEWSYRVNLIV